MIKKIIMDLDNTLFDTKTSAVLAYDKFLKKYNYEIDSLMLYKTLGKFDYSKESLFDYLKKILNDFNIEKYNDFKKMYIEEVGLIDSKTKETLAYLKEKYELIVFSNWVYDLQYAILEKEDLIKYFKHIFTSDKIGIKEDKNNYLKLLYPYKPEEILVVGDDLITDIKVPKSIGMQTIHIDLLKKTDCINKISDLKEIL